MDSHSQSGRAALNENQARRLRVTCHYIDRLLVEIEGILHAPSSKTVFPRYSADVASELHQTIEEYVGRIRSQLLQALDDRGIYRHEPPISASHAIRVALDSIDISLEELEPKYMRGYGEVKQEAAIELNRFISETRALVSELTDYVGARKTPHHAPGEESDPSR